MCDLNESCNCKPTAGDALINMVELTENFFKQAQAFSNKMRAYDLALQGKGPVPEPEEEGENVLEIEDYCYRCGRLCHCDEDYDRAREEAMED